MNKCNVAVLIFDDVEVLNFCGPSEVFSVTGRRDDSNPFNVYTVAERTPVRARNALSVNPHYTFDTCPQPDILVVPGGGGKRADGTPFGTRKELSCSKRSVTRATSVSGMICTPSRSKCSA